MSKLAKLVKMSQNGPTYIIWNLTKNGSLLPKITHICGKETKFQNRIDTPERGAARGEESRPEREVFQEQAGQ